MKYYLSIDVGGTEIKYNVLNENGKMMEETKVVKTPMPAEGMTHEGAKEDKYKSTRVLFIETIENLIKESDYEISGLAASMPGYINSTTGILEKGGALKYMDGINFYEETKHFGIPVVLENDARCVAMAEYGAGNAQGIENFACITLGTGVGSGLMVNGKLVEGVHSRGGEFGTNLVAKGADGKYLTYHEMCSMSALIYRYAVAKNIDFMETKVTGRDVYDQIDDPEVLAVIEDWYENIAVAIFNLASTFDCEKVLIGGGVSARHDLIEGIEKALESLNHKTHDDAVWDRFRIPVEACQFRNSSGLIGAFYRFKQLQGV